MPISKRGTAKMLASRVSSKLSGLKSKMKSKRQTGISAAGKKNLARARARVNASAQVSRRKLKR